MAELRKPTYPGSTDPPFQNQTTVWLRWGLIASWAKDAGIAGRTINARGETVHEKPAFRAAFKSRRCLIPIEGFFEWKRVGAKTKTPYFIHRRDDDPMALAGLWESWIDHESGAVIETCAIVTTTANDLLRPLHDRMPVILGKNHFDVWLDGNSDSAAVRELLVSLPSEELSLQPVGPMVNSARNEGPALIEPVPEGPQQRSLFD